LVAGLGAAVAGPSLNGMSRTGNAVGTYGERVAARALTTAGMSVLDRNWRCRAGEIDLVARDGPTVVFCEVKTRRGDAYGTPAAAVGVAKVRKLRLLAAAWLAEHPQVRGEVRFDVVSVHLNPAGPATVEHLRAAF
jgi:putative endonuclease